MTKKKNLERKKLDSQSHIDFSEINKFYFCRLSVVSLRFFLRAASISCIGATSLDRKLIKQHPLINLFFYFFFSSFIKKKAFLSVYDFVLPLFIPFNTLVRKYTGTQTHSTF